MTEAIAVEDVHKTYRGGVRALNGVSFDVENATVFGLLGPNGSGKTTLVRVLTTTLRQDAGTARLLGHDVGRDAALVRTLFGLAGQYAAVDENLTGRENLMMIARLNHMSRPSARARTDELLVQFDLAEARDRTLKTYSGGMRRRLDVAAALVTRPPVLFLDEPTTGLDPQSRNGLWDVIEELVEAGTTVLLTTQYLEEADRLADDIAVLDRGEVIARGSPRSLKADLGATVLEVGLANLEEAGRAAAALAPLSDREVHLVQNAVEITVDDGPRTAVDALRLLAEVAIEPASFTLREPSLDDVFLALTGHQTDDEVEVTPRRSRRRS